MIILGITKKSIGLFLDYKNNVELAYWFPLQKKTSDYFWDSKKSVGLVFTLQKKASDYFLIYKKSLELFLD